MLRNKNLPYGDILNRQGPIRCNLSVGLVRLPAETKVMDIKIAKAFSKYDFPIPGRLDTLYKCTENGEWYYYDNIANDYQLLSGKEVTKLD